MVDNIAAKVLSMEHIMERKKALHRQLRTLHQNKSELFPLSSFGSDTDLVNVA
jgi:hypothetical protein